MANRNLHTRHVPSSSFRNRESEEPVMGNQVEKHRLRLLWAAFFMTAIAAVFELASLFCDNWVSGTIHYVYSTTTYTYGLFYGEQTIDIPVGTDTRSRKHSLQFCCSYQENLCLIYSPDIIRQNCEAIVDDFANEFSYAVLHNYFIPAGIWTSVIVFVPFAALCGIVAAVLAILDLLCLSSRSRIRLFALIAAICSAVTTFLSLILGGAMTYYTPFGEYVTVVDGSDTTATKNIGFGYWFLLLSNVLYCIHIGILFALRTRNKVNSSLVV